MPPLSSGLMQFLSYGTQDIYITANPRITFFKNVYRDHTNNAFQHIDNIFKSDDVRFVNFKKTDQFSQHECSICIDEFNDNDSLTVRPCGHIFHKQCHQLNMINCPICRQ